MVDADPTLVALLDCPSESGSDTSQLEDGTSEATDGDTNSNVTAANNWKIGKAPDDAMRIEFAEDKANIAVSDTVTVYHASLHNWGDSELIPYSGSATAVVLTNKLTATPSGGTSVFTLTQAFIDDLFDLGSGKWGCRFMEKDSFQAGDTSIQEVEGDLTTGAPAIERRRYPHIINVSASI